MIRESAASRSSTADGTIPPHAAREILSVVGGAKPRPTEILAASWSTCRAGLARPTSLEFAAALKFRASSAGRAPPYRDPRRVVVHL